MGLWYQPVLLSMAMLSKALRRGVHLGASNTHSYSLVPMCVGYRPTNIVCRISCITGQNESRLVDLQCFLTFRCIILLLFVKQTLNFKSFKVVYNRVTR
ncbi:hypothetical protein Hanom_Chr06g00493751 [Helianthus anomalus]